MELIHVKLLDRANIKCQNGPVLPPAQVFYFNGQALLYLDSKTLKHSFFCLVTYE
jgi:hypothetical protein